MTTKAIVLSAIKYADADLIVKAYTLSDGIQTYMLKGILKSKRSRFKSSMFQPLTQLEIVARHHGKGKMEYLRDARLVNTYNSLHTEVVKSTLVMFLAEVLRNSIVEEEPNPGLFHFLQDSFLQLDRMQSNANFHLLFLVKLALHLGFYPETSRIDLPYFNLLEGHFEATASGKYTISGENLELLRLFLGIDFDDLTRVKLNQSNRRRFLNMLLLYYELHIEGFSIPRSLSVLNEIFG